MDLQVSQQSDRSCRVPSGPRLARVLGGRPVLRPPPVCGWLARPTSVGGGCVVGMLSGVVQDPGAQQAITGGA